MTSSTYMGGINPLGGGLFWKSVRMSLTVSVTALILAYPVAYLLAMLAGRRKYVLLLVIIVPFLTSYLLRILAWRVILNPQGVVNTFLQDTLGVTTGADRRALEQQLRDLPRAELRVGAVRRPADLRDARRNRRAPARGELGPRRFAVADVLDGHVPAVDPGGDRGLHLRVHPDDRRVRHAAARRRPVRASCSAARSRAPSPPGWTGSSARRWPCSSCSPSRSCSRSSAGWLNVRSVAA